MTGRAAAPAAGAGGSRYLVLPTEIVSRMQSGDFGVSMSEIEPGGYITASSFTNDGRYRVAELADDIRRNGVSRPLVLYMGRTRPVVSDGQHRYVAAVMAGITELLLEIAYPEDVRDVTDWARSQRMAAPGTSASGREWPEFPAAVTAAAGAGRRPRIPPRAKPPPGPSP